MKRFSVFLSGIRAINFAKCKQKLITQWYIFYIILSNAPGNRSKIIYTSCLRKLFTLQLDMLLYMFRASQPASPPDKTLEERLINDQVNFQELLSHFDNACCLWMSFQVEVGNWNASIKIIVPCQANLSFSQRRRDSLKHQYGEINMTKHYFYII